MAAPSEPFTWKLFGNPKQVCCRCERKLRIKDVGLHRRLYPGGVDEFLCKTCQRADVDAMIARNRESLGLPPRTPHH